jgi:hypothetical protein
VITSTYPDDLATTEVSSASDAWSDAVVETMTVSAAGTVAALHAHLVLRFQSMVTEHRPGCAFVAPYPSGQDLSHDEIFVIPFRKGAAFFSCGFLNGDRITMVVRIGDHCVVTCAEDDEASLAAEAERLLSVALSGCDGEDIRTQDRRYEPY